MDLGYIQRSIKLGKFTFKLPLYKVNIDKKFEDLSQDLQKGFIEYYSNLYKTLDRRLVIMAREASIQLCLQNAVVVHQFFQPPLAELRYDSYSSPTSRWYFDVAFLIVSIFTSAYSTFKKSFKKRSA